MPCPTLLIFQVRCRDDVVPTLYAVGFITHGLRLPQGVKINLWCSQRPTDDRKKVTVSFRLRRGAPSRQLCVSMWSSTQDRFQQILLPSIPSFYLQRRPCLISHLRMIVSQSKHNVSDADTETSGKILGVQHKTVFNRACRCPYLHFTSRGALALSLNRGW